MVQMSEYGKMGFGGSEPEGTLPITANGNYDVKDYANAEVNVPAPSPTLIEKSITANGTYNATDDGADGYSKVEVNVPSANIPYIEETYGENSSGKLQLRDWKYVGHTHLVQAQGSAGFGRFELKNSLTVPSTVVSADTNAFKGLSVPYIEYGGQVMSENMFYANQYLSKVWIRETCTTIPASSYSVAPFFNTVSRPYVYVEANSKPAGFETYWDWTNSSSYATVVYGQKTKPW